MDKTNKQKKKNHTFPPDAIRPNPEVLTGSTENSFQIVKYYTSTLSKCSFELWNVFNSISVFVVVSKGQNQQASRITGIMTALIQIREHQVKSLVDF